MWLRRYRQEKTFNAKLESKGRQMGEQMDE